MTYYVYALCDPRTHQPFYIGKGKWRNKRHLDHLRETEENTTNRHRFYKIQSLKSQGLDPVIQILHSNIIDEDEAYTFEEDKIKEFGLVGEGGCLTNVMKTARPPNHLGRKRSKEWCDRHGNYWRGKSKTEDQKRKISETLKGNIPWNKGKFGVVTQTPESNKSRSDSLKAYWAKKKQNEERN